MGMIMLEVRAEFIDLSFDAQMGKKSEIKQEEILVLSVRFLHR